MAQPMTPATKPGLGLCGGEGAKEGLGGADQMTSGVEETEHGDSGDKAGAVDPPKASSTIAEPDHQGSGINALASGF